MKKAGAVFPAPVELLINNFVTIALKRTTAGDVRAWWPATTGAYLLGLHAEDADTAEDVGRAVCGAISLMKGRINPSVLDAAYSAWATGVCLGRMAPHMRDLSAVAVFRVCYDMETPRGRPADVDAPTFRIHERGRLFVHAWTSGGGTTRRAHVLIVEVPSDVAAVGAEAFMRASVKNEHDRGLNSNGVPPGYATNERTAQAVATMMRYYVNSAPTVFVDNIRAMAPCLTMCGSYANTCLAIFAGFGGQASALALMRDLIDHVLFGSLKIGDARASNLAADMRIARCGFTAFSGMTKRFVRMDGSNNLRLADKHFERGTAAWVFDVEGYLGPGTTIQIAYTAPSPEDWVTFGIRTLSTTPLAPAAGANHPDAARLLARMEALGALSI